MIKATGSLDHGRITFGEAREPPAEKDEAEIFDPVCGRRERFVASPEAYESNGPRGPA